MIWDEMKEMKPSYFVNVDYWPSKLRLEMAKKIQSNFIAMLRQLDYPYFLIKMLYILVEVPNYIRTTKSICKPKSLQLKIMSQLVLSYFLKVEASQVLPGLWTNETRSGLFGFFFGFLPEVAATIWSRAIRLAVEDEEELTPIIEVALLWSMSSSSIVVTTTY